MTTTPHVKDSQQFTVVFNPASAEAIEEESTTSIPTSSDDPLTEKTNLESQLLSILNDTVKEHEKSWDKIAEAKKSMEKIVKERDFVVETTSKKFATSQEDDETTIENGSINSVEAVAEAALRNALKERDDKTEEFVEHSKAFAATLLSDEKKSADETDADPEITSPATATEFTSTTTEESSAVNEENEETTTEALETTTGVVTPQVPVLPPPSILSTDEAAEVSEVLSLIEADERAENADGGPSSDEIRRLREHTRAKIMSFLQRRVEKLTAELDKTTESRVTTSTTVPPTTEVTEATTSTTVPSTTEEVTEPTTNATTVTTTITTTTMIDTTEETEKSTESKEDSTTTKELTTSSTKATSTTEGKSEEVAMVAFKQIPEAEEEDPNDVCWGMELYHINFVRAYLEYILSAAEELETTTTTTAVPKSGTTVYNLHASANAQADPKLANVITPIAGILDNIGPIIAPLIRSRLAAAKREYELTSPAEEIYFNTRQVKTR
ncbi:unnamed protein product [Cylicostephanus goldi]|uniref:Uncharacterized protein n=1 Tax=Cylicostephanus goldi TaxID=71465 RepID=A0A3P6RX25_CYLGO|nr:unnamed protein product [Cylicostephanus goldi]